MRCRNLWAALIGVVLLTCLMIAVDGDAQSKFPSLENLRQRNVALEMEGFNFVAGMRRNSKGGPNGNGFDIAPIRWFGSGFIAGEDGSIITNYHVARRALKGRAKFDDGSSYEIRHIKIYDPKQDLAILKIFSNKKFPTVKLGNPAYVQPLNRVLAVGNPGGRGINMTEGQVSQIVRDDNGGVDTIVHTAPITSGNSGGALYKGQYVIGVNASVILASYGGGTAFNQAIPINKAQRLLQKYYKQNIPFKAAFPTDMKTIIKKKFKQIDGTNGRVQAAKDKKPGMYPFNFRFSNLEDYLITVDSPGRDLAILIYDSKGQIGYGDLREIGVDGILISSDYAKNVIIYIANYDPQPANFAVKIGYIAW
jgi:S1-C subfamily serine protease